MTTTIAALWNGNIAPYEKNGKDDPETRDLFSLMARNRERLYNVTTPQQQEIFEKYVDCSEECLLRLTEQAFCQGFCLAAKIMAEAFHS